MNWREREGMSAFGPGLYILIWVYRNDAVPLIKVVDFKKDHVYISHSSHFIYFWYWLGKKEEEERRQCQWNGSRRIDRIDNYVVV